MNQNLVLSEIKNNSGPICKRYIFGEGGHEVKPAANVYSAKGRRVEIRIADFGSYLNQLAKKDDTAIVLGIWPARDEYEIVTEDSGNKDEENGVISRSSQYFSYANNDAVSVMYLDFDSGTTYMDEFLRDLDKLLIPALIGESGRERSRIMRWIRPSTSGGVSIGGKTGAGCHVFIPVKNAKPDLIEQVHRWAWLQPNYGGGYKITKAGTVLPQSLIDPMVKGPERICFTADAAVEGDHTGQDVEIIERTCNFEPGGIIDCELALAILSSATSEFVPKWRTRRSFIQQSPECLVIREEWKAEQIVKRVLEGTDERTAREQVNNLSDKIILSSEKLLRTDGSEVHVLDILLNPQEWLGKTGFADPIKREVGRNVAMVVGKPEAPLLKSFSHGGVYYRLMWAYTDIIEWLNSEEDANEIMDKAAQYMANSALSGMRGSEVERAVAAKLDVRVGAVRDDVAEQKEMIAESIPEDEDEFAVTSSNISKHATHYEIISDYLYRAGECRGFGESLYVWSGEGTTLWERRQLGLIKTQLGAEYPHVTKCQRVSDYNGVAKEIIGFHDNLLDQWHTEPGVPCVDGFYKPDGSVVPYTKELGCRYKLGFKPDFKYDGKFVWFQKILDNVDNKILFQQLIGMILTGMLVEHQMVAVFMGKGGSGKGTTNRVLQAALPPGRVTNISLAQMNDPKYVVSLLDAVVNIVPEMDKYGKSISMTGFRALTGGDFVSGWGLYKGVRTFKPNCSHILNMNNWPVLDGAGEELFRRVGKTIVYFNERKGDLVLNLEQKIIEFELPKFLGWGLDGAAMVLQEGLFSDSSEQWYSRWVSSFDPVELFFNEYLVYDVRGYVRKPDLWKRFKEFSEESGYYLKKKGEFFSEFDRYRVKESIFEGFQVLRGVRWSK